MYTVLNQNVSWFYKKIKLGVRKPKIPQAQTCSLLLSTRHTLRSHSRQAEQLSSVVMDGMFTGIYLQHFPKVTGRHSSLPFLVNLSLVSSMKRDKSENGCSAASPTENQNTRQWPTHPESSVKALRTHPLQTVTYWHGKTARNKKGCAEPNSSHSASLLEQRSSFPNFLRNYRVIRPTTASKESHYCSKLDSVVSVLLDNAC